MDPQIRYVKTSDGISIAYQVRGEGKAFVFMPNMPGALLAENAIPETRTFVEALASGRLMIQYDPRGAGLSTRNATEFSLETMVADLEAVVDTLAGEPCTLWVGSTVTPVAITFAARHPELVSNLIIWCGVARGSEYYVLPQVRAISRLSDNFELLLETVAHFYVGWSAGPAASGWARSISESIDRETYIAGSRALAKLDATELLSKVQAPTLLLHRREFAAISLESTKALASAIPDSQLVLLDGSFGGYAVGDWHAIVDAVADFVGDRQEESARNQMRPSSTAVILFADIVDSTGLTERLGDDAFREKARGLDEAMRAAIRENAGGAVEGKTLGDGVLAVFTSAKQAIGCAQACHHAALAVGLALHAGIHAGDVIREADPDGRGNVYGGAVNIAARVAAASAAGETLVSGTVRELARTSAGVVFEDRGEQALKGVGDPVRVFAVREA